MELPRLNKEDRENVLKALMKTRLMISNKDRWCQGAYESNRPNEAGDWTIRHCTTGALAKATNADLGHINHLFMIAKGLLNQQTSDNCLESFNDSHSHEEVLALLDRVIEGLEQQNADDTVPVAVVSTA